MTRPYAVCSVPRSGSSLLCELLCLSGVAGAPTEYLDATQEAEFRRVWGVDDTAAYLRALVDRKTSPNGVFGLKVHFDQMADSLGERDLAEVLPGLSVVYIRRADALAQAISYTIARQTEQWASTHEAVGRPRYRRSSIEESLRQIGLDEQRWERWFDDHRLDPLRIDHAELVARPWETVQLVLDHVGVNERPDTSAVATLERQSGVRSRLWGARFRAGTATRRVARALTHRRP